MAVATAHAINCGLPLGNRFVVSLDIFFSMNDKHLILIVIEVSKESYFDYYQPNLSLRIENSEINISPDLLFRHFERQFTLNS